MTDIVAQPLVANWPGNVPIDVVRMTPWPPAARAWSDAFSVEFGPIYTEGVVRYRETNVLGDPATGLGLASVDPLLGLAIFGAQLSEFIEGLGYVIAELETRSDLLADAGQLIGGN
jgi:hypothetical protein